jgi:hypothetical protein
MKSLRPSDGPADSLNIAACHDLVPFLRSAFFWFPVRWVATSRRPVPQAVDAGAAAALLSR